MTAKDLSDTLTMYRQACLSILNADGVFAKVQSARLRLDLLGVTAPFAVSAKVTKGPAMPAPDSTDPAATDADKPWTKPDQGENKKFSDPDKLLALVAAFQHLQDALAQNVTFASHAGPDVTMPAGAALAAIL